VSRPLDRSRLPALAARERDTFLRTHPACRAAYAAAAGSLLGGVPMPWMSRWPTPFPIYLERATGAEAVDVDGNVYVDFCLGDSAAMAGHAPAAVQGAVAEQAGLGLARMLPGAGDARVGAELARRFGLPRWQFALSATDANRFALRLAREATGRDKVLVFTHCYHGTVDDTLAGLVDGRTVARTDAVGSVLDPALTSRAVEFNDLAGVEAALDRGDVACVLTEPALTNVGIVLPDPGFLDGLRRLTEDAGALLIIDETHTWCVGPGGYTAAHGLRPDMLTIGKAIGGGVPAAAYGMTAELAERLATPRLDANGVPRTKGVGGTLAGNALSLAAIGATLAEVLTEPAFARMTETATRFAAGVRAVLDDLDVGWHVTQLGCRVEYQFRASAPRSGGAAAASADRELDRLLHLYLVNRGVLLTPFHAMALMCPGTMDEQVDRHTDVFAQALAELYPR
jgi:glutamate-1-semialdehyde 2,1-aminomutase